MRDLLIDLMNLLDSFQFYILIKIIHRYNGCPVAKKKTTHKNRHIKVHHIQCGMCVHPFWCPAYVVNIILAVERALDSNSDWAILIYSMIKMK